MLDIDKMEAGAELDAQVAERVRGWHRGQQVEGRQYWFTKKPPKPGYDPGFPCPYYSTDIAAAWEVHKNIYHRSSSVQDRYSEAIITAVRTRLDLGGVLTLADVFLLFEPVDISRAACKAVEKGAA